MLDRNMLAKLYAECFPEDSDAFMRFFMSAVPDEDIAVVDIDGRYASAGYIVPKKCRLHGKALPAVYFSALGTLVEYRRRGLIGQVIAEMLHRCRRRGIALAGLVPFDYDFYKRFGFADAAYCSDSQVVGGRFEAVRATYDDAALLADIYADYVCGADMYFAADAAEFKRKAEELALDGGGIYLLRDGNVATGYIAVDDGKISAYAERGDVIRYASGFVGMEYVNFKRRVRPYAQVRIVDVAAMLSRVKYHKDGRIGISVTDGLIPENTAKYSISVSGGMACSVDVVREEHCDIVCDIGGLAERIFGGDEVFEPINAIIEDAY